MKTTGLLISLALIVVMGIAGSAYAQCTAVLADGLFPTGGSVQVGDTIEYLMTVSVPNVPGYCTLYDVDLYFFPPAGEPDPCDNLGGGILIASGLTLTPGGPVYTYTSADNAALSHVVTLGDLTDADGEVIAADMATSFYIEGGTGDQQCDESSSVVYGTNPCIDVTKDACGFSKVGDDVTYTICITNCSNPPAPLYNVVVTDPMLGGTLPGFPSELDPDESVCLDFVYTVQEGDPDPLENTVTVQGEDEYGNLVTGDGSAIVDLLHPSFTVDMECLTVPVTPGGTADIGVAIENTGDVDLLVTTDHSQVPPFTLYVGQTYQTTVYTDDPGGVECVFDEINVTATIPPEFCDLPNVLTGYDDVCCPVDGPCIEITKEVDCDISSVGDEVVYEICITNCSDPAGTLYNVVVNDPLLGGDLGFPSTLGPGEMVCMTFPYTIQEGDADPLNNTVTLSAESEYGTAVSDYAEEQVDLIHPSFTVEKECLTEPVPSGGTAEFLITITNTGDWDLWIETDEAAIPGFALMVGDPIFTQTVTTDDPGGVDCIFNAINVTATLYPDECEIGTELTGYAEACCAIDGPCIDITKEVDCDISSVGDEVIYEICITNCSDPAATLYNVVVTDSLLGGVLGFPSELAPDETVCMTFPYTIMEGDADPLLNMVTVSAESEHGTAVSDYAEESVDLIHPSFEVMKECLTDPVPMGGDAEFLITITNTGDSDLWIETDEVGIPGFALMVADPIFTQTVTVPDTGAVECIFNAINVTATLYPDECEIGTELTGYAEACCPVDVSGCGRWTGGGTIDWEASIPEGAHVTHGFQFHCDLRHPNRLQVNWTGGNRWHMMELLSADCWMNPQLPPPDPPEAPINEVFAVGEGRYNNTRGYIAEFHFTDEGEPGMVDWAHITITAPDGVTVVLEAEGRLAKGNHQAHRDNKAECGGDGLIDDGDSFKSPESGEVELPSDQRDAMLPSVAFSQAHPNPFKDSVRIQFGLPQSGTAAIDVFDVTGRHVVNLIDRDMSAGTHDVTWNGRNTAGIPMPAGVYFYRVRLADDTLMKKMIMIDPSR